MHTPTTPDAPLDSPTRSAPAAAPLSGLASRTDRTAQAQAIRASLDNAAAAINAHHAQVLAAVITMHRANIHRDLFGFSALRDLLLSHFDFTHHTAGAIAAIARLSGKFKVLTEAATSGTARIDQVAYAIRQLDKTPAMRLFARTPFREPASSPFDPDPNRGDRSDRGERTGSTGPTRGRHREGKAPKDLERPGRESKIPKESGRPSRGAKRPRRPALLILPVSAAAAAGRREAHHQGPHLPRGSNLPPVRAHAHAQEPQAKHT